MVQDTLNHRPCCGRGPLHAQSGGERIGGVALGIHQDLLPFVTSRGIIGSQRAAWACLEHPTWGRIGFAGIYSPNDGVGRTALWNELFGILQSAYRWLFLGDFNMVENAMDQLGGDGGPPRGREARARANLI